MLNKRRKCELCTQNNVCSSVVVPARPILLPIIYLHKHTLLTYYAMLSSNFLSLLSFHSDFLLFFSLLSFHSIPLWRRTKTPFTIGMGFESNKRRTMISHSNLLTTQKTNSICQQQQATTHPSVLPPHSSSQSQLIGDAQTNTHTSVRIESKLITTSIQTRIHSN